MKQLILPLLLAFIAFGCSSDDSNNEQDMSQDTVHITLRLNSNDDTYNDEVMELETDQIEDLGGVLRIRFKNNNSVSFNVSLPDPIEEVQYGIKAYVNSDPNVSSIAIPNDGIYLSTDGRVTISKISGNSACAVYKGNLSINYRRQDNRPGTLNIQGNFDIPTDGCTEM